MATRIVSSTIVRPDIESRVGDSSSGRKRSLPDSPDSHRRHRRPSLSSRLSSSNSGSNQKADSPTTTTSTTTTATPSSGTGVQGQQQAQAPAASGSGSGTVEPGSSTVSRDNTEAMEDGEVPDKKNAEDGTQRKRPRLAMNPAEDAKRGRRMMGMILGTLGQFKKQQQQQQQQGTEVGGAGVAGKEAPVASGIASREALQKRVQEKLQRERELNEELRKKEQEERRARMEKAEAQRRRDPAPTGPRGAASKRRRNEVQWENGYILTETRPRLRYMPKILNDTTRKRLQEQNKDADDKKTTSSASSKTEINDDVIAEEAGMDLDGDEDMVVDQDVVVDVKEKEKEEEQKDGDEDKETTKTTGDDSTSKTPTPASAPEFLTTTANDVKNVTDDVDMSAAARNVESDKVKGSNSPSEDTESKASADDTVGSEDSRVKPELINISLV
ncbi:hypothetical protein BGZ68_007318 [Mortierella alpina]|nr:hypothetical protein BGZ68_007318 [Mortierella alpina]